MVSIRPSWPNGMATSWSECLCWVIGVQCSSAAALGAAEQCRGICSSRSVWEANLTRIVCCICRFITQLPLWSNIGTSVKEDLLVYTGRPYVSVNGRCNARRMHAACLTQQLDPGVVQVLHMAAGAHSRTLPCCSTVVLSCCAR